MAATLYGNTWFERLSRLRRRRRVQTGVTLGLGVLGPVLAFLTFLGFGRFDLGASSQALRLILLADFIYVMVLAALVLSRLLRIMAERRSKSAGSQLHLRLSAVFALVALTPTILVAVFAVLSINMGLEGWFSDRVRQVVANSLAAAEAYASEHRDDLREDASAFASYLNRARAATPLLPDEQLRPVLTQGQALIQRGLREAYMIDGAGVLKTRGERSYLFDYEPPSAEDLAKARSGDIVLIEDGANNEFRALVHLTAFADRYLYIARNVDGKILSLLDETRETVGLYHQLESERGRLLFEFGLLYLGFAVILILAATWLGLWFAERLSRPVGRLVSAAERVGAGDLDMRVLEDEGEDEIATLGRVFNQMTHQLKGQRDALIEGNQQTEERRRLFDSVLSSITAGVIGLDAGGRVEFANPAALRLLSLSPPGRRMVALSEAVPEFAPLFEKARALQGESVQEELRLLRQGRMESLLVRLSGRRGLDGRLEGYVVAFDDVTDLVSAQRMAAWGDVARRIAHEIKNPLTPIQLSAERLRRKFAPMLGAQGGELEQYAEVIVRQTNDLRRIVDEFSKFARMPEPERRPGDLVKLLRDALTLQEAGQPNVRFTAQLPEAPLMAEIDSTMLTQALTNLLKNAGEALEARAEVAGPDYQPQIRVSLDSVGDRALLRIADNGTGLPPDRARLFEPYVTTRAKGTGLGLPIVKKIIEEHGGVLQLSDAPLFEGETQAGAMAEIYLPLLGEAPDQGSREER